MSIQELPSPSNNSYYNLYFSTAVKRK